MRRVVLFIAAMLMIVCKSLTGYAQETTADIQGFISDGSIGLAGATVVACIPLPAVKTAGIILPMYV
jgi:hypothetical protein